MKSSFWWKRVRLYILLLEDLLYKELIKHIPSYLFYCRVFSVNHLFPSRWQGLWGNTSWFALAIFLIRNRIHAPDACWFSSPSALMFCVERQRLSPIGKLPYCCSVESQGNQRATYWPYLLSGLVAFYQ